MDQKTKKFVEACEQRIAKATDEPWRVELAMHNLALPSVVGKTVIQKRWNEYVNGYEPSRTVDCLVAKELDSTNGNAEFIANARTDMPEAMRIIREQDAEIERLKPDAEAWRNGVAILEELRARVIPCGHTIGDMIGGEGSVTKCGACLAAKQAERAKMTTIKLG